MKIQETNIDNAAAIALSALGWALADDARATRLLALTGLAPDDIRDRIGDPALLAAILRFLEAHEPDLVACAADLRIDPADLVQARQVLEG